MSPTALVPTEDAEGEEGFLDLIEIGTTSLAKASEAVQRIAELQSENTVRTELNTKQLEAIAQAQPDQKNRLVKQVFDIVAGDLSNLAKGMNDQAATFSSAFATAMDATSKALAYQEFWSAVTPVEKAQYAEAIGLIDKNAPAMERSLSELRETIAGLPRVTTVFNRAKKNAMAAIDNVRTVLTRANNLVVELRKGGFFNAQIALASSTQDSVES